MGTLSECNETLMENGRASGRVDCKRKEPVGTRDVKITEIIDFFRNYRFFGGNVTVTN
jgi:hypothetical protein